MSSIARFVVYENNGTTYCDVKDQWDRVVAQGYGTDRGEALQRGRVALHEYNERIDSRNRAYQAWKGQPFAKRHPLLVKIVIAVGIIIFAPTLYEKYRQEKWKAQQKIRDIQGRRNHYEN